MMLFMIDGFLEWEIRLFKDYCLWKEVLLLYCKEIPFFRHRDRLCEIPIRCIPVNRMRTNGGEEYGIMLLEPFTKDF